MYSDNNHFQDILDRCLSDEKLADFDKRVGSVTYNALAPFSLELSNFYLMLDIATKQSYLLSASGANLDKRAYDYGINRKQASKAIRVIRFYKSDNSDCDVPVGTQFLTPDDSGIIYTYTGESAENQHLVECDTAGAVGNTYTGRVVASSAVPYLSRAMLGDIYKSGVDAEDDETFRSRCIYEITNKPFGGNIADYQKWVLDYGGVGHCKIFPVWRGGGTVLISVVDGNNNPCTEQFCHNLKEAMDPSDKETEGYGIAPIGHFVTVTSPLRQAVVVKATVQLPAGVTVLESIGSIYDVLQKHFAAIRADWGQDHDCVVYHSKIISVIIDSGLVISVKKVELNDEEADVIYEDTQNERKQYLPYITKLIIIDADGNEGEIDGEDATNWEPAIPKPVVDTISIFGHITEVDNTVVAGATIAIPEYDISVKSDAFGDFTLEKIPTDAVVIFAKENYFTLKMPAQERMSVIMDKIEDVNKLIILGIVKAYHGGALSDVDITVVNATNTLDARKAEVKTKSNKYGLFYLHNIPKTASLKFELEDYEDALIPAAETMEVFLKSSYITVQGYVHNTARQGIEDVIIIRYPLSDDVISVTGDVTDTNNQGIGGVNVIIADGVTDSTGHYSIDNVPRDATLLFKKDGYKTITHTADETVNIIMESYITVTGIVNDEDGNPIADVIISCQHDWRNETTTDATGAFTLNNVLESDKLYLHKAGYFYKYVDVSSDPLTIVMKAEDTTQDDWGGDNIDPDTVMECTGVVYDADGNGLSDVQIRVYSDNDDGAYTETDFNGNFSIHDVPKNGGWLIFQKHGFKTQQIEVEEASKDNITVTLLAGDDDLQTTNDVYMTVNGVVQNQEGTKITGAVIRIQYEELSTASDENGNFTIQIPSEDSESSLIISATGYVTQYIKPSPEMTIVMSEDTTV